MNCGSWWKVNNKNSPHHGRELHTTYWYIFLFLPLYYDILSNQIAWYLNSSWISSGSVVPPYIGTQRCILDWLVFGLWWEDLPALLGVNIRTLERSPWIFPALLTLQGLVLDGLVAHLHQGAVGAVRTDLKYTPEFMMSFFCKTSII